ncbi:PREDICTED: non-functional pseudokinase ZED1-like, partial [Camelina sativa]|uniref:Non-functional pseudokinase ZED1-like n=1 Tax=Camelina sativa TaxID=90675 RepID=A0ABM0Z071_CAMSA
ILQRKIQSNRATDSFSHNNALVRSRPSSYQCYRGMMEDRLVLVKKWEAEYSSRNGKTCCDIAISSMVSGHKNFLKLLGCCLEFPYPVLVYEYAESIICRPQNGSKYLFDVNLPWNMRMKIAKEVEDALTYLHTAFSKSIIHKDIIPCKIFLDEKGTAKLTEFDNSVLIPEGEKFVEDVIEGTFGYLDHNYMNTGRVTENTDVYGFGAFMLTLLTAMNPSLVDKLYKDCPIKLVEDDRFVEIIDPEVLENCKEQELLQMKAILILSLRCIGCVGEVPKMIEVGKELKRMLVQAKTKLH